MLCLIHVYQLDFGESGGDAVARENVCRPGGHEKCRIMALSLGCGPRTSTICSYVGWGVRWVGHYAIEENCQANYYSQSNIARMG